MEGEKIGEATHPSTQAGILWRTARSLRQTKGLLVRGRDGEGQISVDRVDSFMTMLHCAGLSCIPALLAEGNSLPANWEKGKVEVRFIGAIPIPSLPLHPSSPGPIK